MEDRLKKYVDEALQKELSEIKPDSEVHPDLALASKFIDNSGGYGYLAAFATDVEQLQGDFSRPVTFLLKRHFTSGVPVLNFLYDGVSLCYATVAEVMDVMDTDMNDKPVTEQYTIDTVRQFIVQTITQWHDQVQATITDLLERIGNALNRPVTWLVGYDKRRGRVLYVQSDGEKFTLILEDFFQPEDSVDRALRILLYFLPETYEDAEAM